MVQWHFLLSVEIILQVSLLIESFQGTLSRERYRGRMSMLTQQADKSIDVTNANENEGLFYPLKVVGICGSIGSGKSFASSLLVSKLNSMLNNSDRERTYAYYIDTDKLAHGVYAPKSAALKQIETVFGQEIISKDGTVDRKALGRIVFADPDEMSKLEHIVWPHVKDLLLKRLTDIRSSCCQDNVESNQHVSPIVVVEGAVLLDANWDTDDMFDAIWVVKASTETSTRRLVDKRGMKETDALRRIEAQYKRRGIGNLEEELNDGTVTAVIENNEEDKDKLWSKMKVALTDHKSWKVRRYPLTNYDVLKENER